MGRDSYLITGHARGGTVAGESLIAASKQANAFCAKQGLVMIFRHSQAGGNAAFGGETDQLLFSCVSESDPEYKRPNIRKDADVVVQDQRN